ncbi:nicotinate-nucleotide adenylyltransferase [Lacticaseibacillus sharpeae]|uniref:Probable nicotinate-nucleotide adenylyltransferase n=1 Tax=Lacticaseibacillus sharpeae JCM 1186 = DSM 20505 TaxID=1291052 RepID=A0A0R1ZPI1_9LACO|nr:nicotinate-nucleotide adenylyltransferase [Lacticaseibacillus sharpeae]KRM56405.1 nicotinic acid mononucleotide adenylyltransferase [Lacticaseibacillus sharpeae JCM 1186 = DSM 20505]
MVKKTVLTHPVLSTELRTQILGKNKRRQVGLFGGTFNPVHTGHLVMADQVGNQLGLDKVCFMPDATPPHVDKKSAIAAKYRVEMLAAAISGNPMFDLELCEVERGGISYSYDTVAYLKHKHPDTDYYFIIGADMVNYLPKWHRIDELVKMVQFVGVKRPGYTPRTTYPVLWVDAPKLEITSTAIRKRVANGESIHYLVPDAVAAYIEKEGLYRE